MCDRGQHNKRYVACFFIRNAREVKPLRYRRAGSGKQTVAIVILSILLLISIAAIVELSGVLLANDDGTIGVTATTGECKIDVIDSTDASLIGDVLDFAVAEGAESVCFEPGATYYTEAFRVKNIGDITVNFRAFISEDEETDRYELQEAFELWITKDPASLENAERLTEFTGRLEADAVSEAYYLVIRMKETAGNEFQNKTYTGIGITVYAVQGNATLE